MTFRKTGRQSRAYVLRCWIEDGHPADRPRDWRFSLHDPDTAARHGFTSLPALLAFLTGELERALAPDPPEDETRPS